MALLVPPYSFLLLSVIRQTSASLDCRVVLSVSCWYLYFGNVHVWLGNCELLIDCLAMILMGNFNGACQTILVDRGDDEAQGSSRYNHALNHVIILI